MGTTSPFGCSLASPQPWPLQSPHSVLLVTRPRAGPLIQPLTVKRLHPHPSAMHTTWAVHHRLLTEWPKDHGLDQGTPCDGTVQPSGRPAGGRTGRVWPTSSPCPPTMFSSTNSPLPLTGHLASEGTHCEVVISLNVWKTMWSLRGLSLVELLGDKAL